MAHPPFLMPERFFAVVAQLAEQRPRNAQVTGPNPVDGSQEGNLFQVFHEIKEIPMTAPNNVTPRSFGR